MKEEKLTLFEVYNTSPWSEGESSNKVEIYAASRDEAMDFWIKEFEPNRKTEHIEAIKMGLRVKYKGGFKDETKVQRCIKCNTEFSEIEVEDATACPACGDTGIPAAIKDDVTVKINWHELRILTIWAENWAKKIQKDDSRRNGGSLLTIMSIAGRLQNQHPDKTKLTLFSEIRELREKLPEILPGSKIETNIDDDSELGL